MSLTDITYLFHPFGIMMIVIIMQLLFRLYNVVTYKKEKSEKYVKADFIVMMLIVIAFLTYEAAYIIIQNS